MKFAGVATLAGWVLLVAVLCLVPVSHGIVEATKAATCEAPVVAVFTTEPGPVAGPSTGIEYYVVTSCRRRSGVRLAVACLVAGCGAAVRLTLLRGGRRPYRRLNSKPAGAART